MNRPSNLVAVLAAMFASLLLAPVARAAAKASGGGEYFVYIGTYTDKASKGIYAFRFEPSTGKTTPLGLMAETPNPAFLAVSPNHRFLYAVNWKGNDAVKGDTVSAYAIDPKTGKLTFLNKVESRGAMPTNLTIDHTGKTLLVVCYGGGNVTGYQILPDGRLSEPTAFDQHTGKSVHREPGPHAHGVIVSPDNRYAFVAELGLDQVYTYRLNAAKGTLARSDPPFVQVPPGTGPRHLAIHPNGRFLYVNDETRPAVTVFQVNEGKLQQIQELPSVPPEYKGRNATAEIQIDRAGKFVYVSNRGHDSIAVFAVDQAKGALTPVEHVSTKGKTPRNFSLDPTGSYLFAANQNSDTIYQFRVDPKTGRLTETGEVLQAPTPVCVLFVKAQ
jgi:6-phosphogluconolactonase